LGISVNFLLAALAAWQVPAWPRLVRLTAGLAAVALAPALWLMAPAWDRLRMTTGVFVNAESILQSGGWDRFLDRMSPQSVKFYKEGATATVSVISRGNSQILLLDGRGEGGTSSSAQALLGHFPMLLGRSIENALVLGLGTGNTAGSLALYPLKRIDIAELEPAVVQAARLFDDINHHLLADPRVRILTVDGRSFLAAAPPASYDLIISQPSLPWVSGAAKLFTREFYGIARSRLRPAGVFVQWFHLYHLDFAGVQSLLKTFSGVFPSVIVAAINRESGEVLLAGSAQPLSVDWNALNSIFDSPERSADLRRIRIPDRGTLITRILFGSGQMAALIGSVPDNTDDNGLIEFSAAAGQYQDTTESNQEELYAHAVDPWSLVSGRPAASEFRSVLIEMAKEALVTHDFRRGLGFIEGALRESESYEADLIAGDLLYILKHYDAAESKWRRCLALQPNDVPAIRRLLSYYGPVMPSLRPPEFAQWQATLSKSGSASPAGPVLPDDPSRRNEKKSAPGSDLPIQ